MVLGELAGKHCRYYEVKYVDYGNAGIATIGDIYELPEDVLTAPVQALQCCLLGFQPFLKDPISKAAVDLAWQNVLFKLNCNDSSLFKVILVEECPSNPQDKQEGLSDSLWLITLTYLGLNLNDLVLKEVAIPLHSIKNQTGLEDTRGQNEDVNGSKITDRDVCDREADEDEDKSDDNRPPTPVPLSIQESCKAKVSQWLLDQDLHQAGESPLLSKRSIVLSIYP